MHYAFTYNSHTQTVTDQTGLSCGMLLVGNLTIHNKNDIFDLYVGSYKDILVGGITTMIVTLLGRALKSIVYVL